MIKERHFAYRMFREKTIKRINAKINLLGENVKVDVFTFLNIRFITSIILFAILFIFNKYGYLIAPIATIIFYILSEKIILDLKIKTRTKKLEEEAIFFFEILSLTLESNKHLKGAIELTSTNIDSELSNEFKKTLNEVKLGKSFTESLISMKERIPSDLINNIILNLTESSIFGNNVTNTLNNQLEYLRDRRLLNIKAEINKLPTKISIISVVFFIPIMLLIILSPVIIEFLLG